jgi:hypothetical protein
MTLVEQFAAFVVDASYDELSPAARDQLKIRILDSLGRAIYRPVEGEIFKRSHSSIAIALSCLRPLSQLISR